MKLYIKQKVFSFRDRFTVKDERGIDMFQIMGEIFSFGKVLHIHDMNECRLLTIRQKLFTLMPRFVIERDGNVIAEIAKDFSFFFVPSLSPVAKGHHAPHHLLWHPFPA